MDGSSNGSRVAMAAWWLVWLLFAIAVPMGSWFLGEAMLVVFFLVLAVVGVRWASAALGKLSPGGRSASAPSSVKKDDFLGGCLFSGMGFGLIVVSSIAGYFFSR